MIFTKTSEYLTDSVNQITNSWHIHLQIFAESLKKIVQKLWEINGKTNVSLFSELGAYSVSPRLQESKA